MNKTQIFTIGPKTVLIITPDGRLEAGEGLSHDEVSRELFKICSKYYGTRTAELERENAALREQVVIRDAEIDMWASRCAAAIYMLPETVIGGQLKEAQDRFYLMLEKARKEAQP